MFWECTVLSLLHVRELPEFFSRGPGSQELASLSVMARLVAWTQSLARKILGQLLLGSWLAVSWRVVWVPIKLMVLLFGLRLITGTLMILLWRCLVLLIFGRIVAGRTSLRLVGLRLMVLACTSLLLNLLLRTWFGVRLKSMVILVWNVAVLFCLCLGLCRRFSVLNFGVPSLHCRPTGLVT